MDTEQTDGGRPRASGWKEAITAWVGVASVLVLGGGLIITNNANREQQRANLKQLKITEQGQVTDRFGRGIDQLGSGKRAVRIGGVYALGQLLHDSPDEEANIIEVLSAYIRDHTHTPAAAASTSVAAALHACTSAPTSDVHRTSDVHPTTDVQAALTILGRRPDPGSHRHIDLTKAHLTGASLAAAYLGGADLREADFTTAYLRGAHLHGAALRGADLHGADLCRADLTGAHLPGADLTGADLTRAHLTGADLTVADLTGARWPLHTAIPHGWVRDPDSGLLKGASEGASNAP